MRIKLCWSVVATLLVSSAFAAPDAGHVVHATFATTVPGYYAVDTPPVLTVKSGEIVKLETVSLSGIPDDPEPFYRENHIPLDNPAVQDIIAMKAEMKKQNLRPRGPPLTGPIAVEGAEPGDMLEVRVHSLKMRADYGINSTRPGGSGPLGDLVPRPWQQVYRLDLKRNVAIFSPTIEIPLHLHLGQMGVAPPPAIGKVSSGPPTAAHGGNFDLREITTGSSLYLPVNVKGALFSAGDPHALQGNGEVTGFSIESNIDAVLEFIVHKGVTLNAPRVETPTHYIVLGIADQLDGAMRMATLEAQQFLKEKEGMDFFTSYSFISLGADFCIARALKPGQMIHVLIPKSYFLSDKKPYWYQPPTTSGLN
jgi:acetamidase/formamidase